MANNAKWTQELRRLVYRCLKQQFGPFSDWGQKHGPQDRKSEYESVLREIASFLTALTGADFKPTAVRQQVEFGITQQGNLKARGHVLTMVLNKAAALEVGFLKTTDLPSQVTLSE